MSATIYEKITDLSDAELEAVSGGQSGDGKEELFGYVDPHFRPHLNPCGCTTSPVVVRPIDIIGK